MERDQENGPPFYRVQVKSAESDKELSNPRETLDLASVRAMFDSLPQPEITARVMFGGLDPVTAQKATELLSSETGTRALAKFNATRGQLLASLRLLKLRG